MLRSGQKLPLQNINLGAADTSGALGLINTELGTITAALLKIGDANSGSITVSSAISAPVGWNTLSLRTGAGIVDGNTTGADLTVTNLALRAVTGIGSADALDTAVSNLAAANTTSGNVAVSNTGGLVVTSSAVDGLTGVTNSGGGSISLLAASPLTVNAPVNAGTGAVNLTAAGNDQLLTINATVSGGADSTFTADKMAIGSTVNVGAAKLTLVPESMRHRRRHQPGLGHRHDGQHFGTFHDRAQQYYCRDDQHRRRQ